MNLNDLYNKANIEQIDIFNWKMHNSKARIIYDEDYTIYMDYSQIKSYTEEKELLGEELGHYYENAYYTFASTKYEVEIAEYKAMKWKALNLCPLKSILSCFYDGIYNVYSIAEKLQISVNTVEFAIKYYKDNNLLMINA